MMIHGTDTTGVEAVTDMDLSDALTETDPEDTEEGPSVMDKEVLEETPTWIVDEE